MNFMSFCSPIHRLRYWGWGTVGCIPISTPTEIYTPISPQWWPISKALGKLQILYVYNVIVSIELGFILIFIIIIM